MQSSRLSRRDALKLGLATACAPLFSNVAAFGAEKTPLYKRLPRWRGFNLLEKFNGGAPFREDDFRNIRDLGFNFVRLPMNYLLWCDKDDRRKFKEPVLKEIDEAVEFGRRYGIHVNINFHRAPGYTVNNPKESPLIWEDDEQLDICALHWRTFAKRYAGIPAEELSFNLFNEPAGVDEKDYYRVVKRLLDEIRAEDPDRLVICDGVDWGGKPCFSFADLRVAQATRGYVPMEISHYGANWVNSAGFPKPQWPTVSFNSLLPSQTKREMSEGIREPWTIEGDFGQGGKLRLKVGTVSQSSELIVTIDGKVALKRKLTSGPGDGEWREVVYSETYKIYQNIFDLDVEVAIPKGARKIEIANVSGDWATITEIGLTHGAADEIVAQGAPDWSATSPNRLTYSVDSGRGKLSCGASRDRAWLREHWSDWRKLADSGVGVMVGEFGAFNQTPHDVAMAWLEDMLAEWKDYGWSWALWNFRGSFGIADSERKDVDYEDWRGLKLDRKMLELLQRY